MPLPDTRRVVAGAALAAGWLVAACADPGAGVDLAVTAPAGTAELVPGGTVSIAWTLRGGPATIQVDVIPLGREVGWRIHEEEGAAPGPGGLTWAGRDRDGARVPPDVYDLVVTAHVDGVLVAGGLRNLAVHGVVPLDPAPGQVRVVLGSQPDAELRYRTVSHRVIRLTTLLDPDPQVAGDERAIDVQTIPGELVPFVRSVFFDGADLTGAPLEAGRYTLVVDADDDGELAYRTPGGIVDWRPLE
jgi:hypothetical protein